MADNVFDPKLPEMITEEFYIEPDTEIVFLSGVPLDNTYEHTIFWHNLPLDRSTQTNYFLSKAFHKVNKQSYQRIDREWLKVYIPFERLYKCNYMMFRNTAYDPHKWWYAFVLDVEYINNNASKVRYELDVMQTWLEGEYFDYQADQCFVERCHSNSDYLFENLVPENIVNSDEYVVDEIKEFNMSRMAVVIYASEYWDGDSWIPAGVKNTLGALQSVHYKVFITTNEDGSDRDDVLLDLANFLNKYVNAGKTDSILSIQMCPTSVLGHVDLFEYSRKLTPPAKGQKLGGADRSFVPKNMKLYSYPFNIIRVNNECGNVKVFKWELFNKNSRGEFAVTGTDFTTSVAVTYPLEYKGISKNMEDCVTFTSFPMCPWSSDAYKAWWAQNAAQVNSDVLGGIASVGAIVAGAYSGNPMLVATGVGGAISSATKINNSLYEAKHLSSPTHGTLNQSFVLPALKNIKFVYTKESLRPEMLRIYDDYFTRYGYAQKRLMKPPMMNRRRWTYVQTVGFEFTSGKLNDKDSKKIKSIFDNGITFWNGPNNVGNYALNNGLFNEPEEEDV